VSFYNSFSKVNSLSNPYKHFEANNKLFFYPNGPLHDFSLGLYFEVSKNKSLINFGLSVSKIGYKFSYNYGSYYQSSFSTSSEIMQIDLGYNYEVLKRTLNANNKKNNSYNIQVFLGLDFSFLFDPQDALYTGNLNSKIVTLSQINKIFIQKNGYAISPKIRYIFSRNKREILGLELKLQLGLINFQELDVKFQFYNGQIHHYKMETNGSFLSISLNRAFTLYRKK